MTDCEWGGYLNHANEGGNADLSQRVEFSWVNRFLFNFYIFLIVNLIVWICLIFFNRYNMEFNEYKEKENNICLLIGL